MTEITALAAQRAGCRSLGGAGLPEGVGCIYVSLGLALAARSKGDPASWEYSQD